MKHCLCGLQLWLGALCVPLTTIACSVPGTEQPASGTGRLSVALASTSASGATYRLRSATFHIAGPTSIDVNTETDPEAQTIGLDLRPGDYTITLDSGWSLERHTDTGVPEVVPAALISPSSQSFTIKARRTTQVRFRFEVDGEALSPGRVEIGIEVQETGADGGTSEQGLLLYVTFDDRAALELPSVGPSGVVLREPTFTTGKRGSALLVTGPDPEGATAKYPASVIPRGRGTIEFWARLVDPPQIVPWNAAPCFFVAPGGQAYALCFSGNDGSYGGGLVATMGNGSRPTGCYTETFTYAGLLGGESAVTSWHHYAMAWDEDGIPALAGVKAQTFLDGAPSPGTFDPCGVPRTPTSFEAPDELLVPYTQDTYAGRSLVIDELRIWDRAKTTFD